MPKRVAYAATWRRSFAIGLLARERHVILRFATTAPSIFKVISIIAQNMHVSVSRDWFTGRFLKWMGAASDDVLDVADAGRGDRPVYEQQARC
jgi:hypothetical protein